MGMLGGKPWADGPFELISPAKYGFTVDKKPEGADIMAAEMIAVHNAILRAVNAVYLQAAKVEASGDDALTTAFANFARLWGEMIEEHHKTEEEMLFPELEALVGAPGSMTPNVEQHHQFEAGLTLYRRYIGDVVEGKQKFNAARLKEVIDSFMPVVTTHLHDEIATLKGLRQYSDNADWDGYMKALGAKLRARGPPDAMSVLFPYVIQIQDRSFENGVLAEWPEAPWIIVALVKWWHTPKHKDWWQFSPCDTSGKPRPLPYA